ncbi:MAG: hypothetical protein R3E87_22595 [Burkholderiaceae bacterium]
MAAQDRDEQAGPKRRQHSAGASLNRLARVAALLLASAVLSAPVAAGEIFITNQALTQSARQGLFVRDGRWYLQDAGRCNHAYIESPAITTGDGRLRLRAHFGALQGIDVQGQCLGPRFASPVTLSGELTVKGDTLSLERMRVDSIEDDATRLAYSVALRTGLVSLPQAIRFGLRETLDDMLRQAPDWRVETRSLVLALKGTEANGVRLRVDFSLQVDAAR